jgi:hypothetical protein
VQSLALGRQQLLDHRVLARGELDHERAAERRQPVDELLHRHVGADRDVVHERQREHEVGPAAVGQRLALEPAPAEARRRVGQVHGERQDLLVALGAEVAVEQLDRPLVGVHGHHRARALGRDARVAPVVRADVPDEVPGLGSGHLAHELVLAASVVVGVAVALAVGRPDALRRIPREPLDQLAHLAHVGHHQLLLEDALDLSLDLVGPVRVARLELRVQEHVGEHALAEAVAEGQQGAHLRGRDAVDRPAQPGVERHALHRLQQQRIQVEHAELAVADPGLALAVALERADVDEHRPRALELHVVGRGVLEHEVVLERGEQQVELDQRGVFQHRECPLVGIRDERDALVAQQPGRLVDEQSLAGGAAACGGLLDQLGADDALVVEQAGGGQRLEVAQPVR